MNRFPFRPTEERARRTFLTLTSALNHPGRVHLLAEEGTAVAMIAETLLDLGASFYTSDRTLRPLLTHTGAESLPPHQAVLHFHAMCSDREIHDIQQAPTGTRQNPYQAATLFIGCTLGAGTGLVWRGPGINNTRTVHLGGIPDLFWELRQDVCRYPLGWDTYFVDGSQIVGLPRSVRVERA